MFFLGRHQHLGGPNLAIVGGFVRVLGRVFAILFEVFFLKIKRKSVTSLVGRGGGSKGHKNCEQKLCEQTGVP